MVEIVGTGGVIVLVAQAVRHALAQPRRSFLAQQDAVGAVRIEPREHLRVRRDVCRLEAASCQRTG